MLVQSNEYKWAIMTPDEADELKEGGCDFCDGAISFARKHKLPVIAKQSKIQSYSNRWEIVGVWCNPIPKERFDDSEKENAFVEKMDRIREEISNPSRNRQE
jgi:hypothetical protein